MTVFAIDFLRRPVSGIPPIDEGVFCPCEIDGSPGFLYTGPDLLVDLYPYFEEFPRDSTPVNGVFLYLLYV